MSVQRPVVTLAPNERLPTTRNLQQHLSPPFQPPLTNAFSLTLGRIRFTVPFEALVYRSCDLSISTRTNRVSGVLALLDLVDGLESGLSGLDEVCVRIRRRSGSSALPSSPSVLGSLGSGLFDLRLVGADILYRGSGFFLSLFTGADESNTEDD